MRAVAARRGGRWRQRVGFAPGLALSGYRYFYLACAGARRRCVYTVNTKPPRPQRSARQNRAPLEMDKFLKKVDRDARRQQQEGAEAKKKSFQKRPNARRDDRSGAGPARPQSFKRPDRTGGFKDNRKRPRGASTHPEEKVSRTRPREKGWMARGPPAAQAARSLDARPPPARAAVQARAPAGAALWRARRAGQGARASSWALRWQLHASHARRPGHLEHPEGAPHAEGAPQSAGGPAGVHAQGQGTAPRSRARLSPAKLTPAPTRCTTS